MLSSCRKRRASAKTKNAPNKTSLEYLKVRLCAGIIFELWSRVNTLVPVLEVCSSGQRRLEHEIIPVIVVQVKENKCVCCLIAIYHGPKSCPQPVPTPSTETNSTDTWHHCSHYKKQKKRDNILNVSYSKDAMETFTQANFFSDVSPGKKT